eukprot:scaffold3081_cov242-Prasinococcus_capsulatus_cf.AAC.2
MSLWASSGNKSRRAPDVGGFVHDLDTLLSGHMCMKQVFGFEVKHEPQISVVVSNLLAMAQPRRREEVLLSAAGDGMGIANLEGLLHSAMVEKRVIIHAVQQSYGCGTQTSGPWRVPSCRCKPIPRGPWADATLWSDYTAPVYCTTT